MKNEVGVAKRENYTTIVNYVASRGKVSYHRARVLLTELGNNLQREVLEGKDLDIDGIFRISYKSNKKDIYSNAVYGLDEQIDDLVNSTGMGRNEVTRLLKSYYMRMKDLIEIGYHVNVKGIGYVIPKQDEDGVYCDTRVSSVLMKPEESSFLILGKDGTLYVDTLKKEELRFSIELSSEINVPYKLVKNKVLKIEEVDI